MAKSGCSLKSVYMFASCFKEMKLRTCSFPRKRNGKKATGKVDRKRGRKRGREMWRKEGEEGRKKGKEGTWEGKEECERGRIKGEEKEVKKREKIIRKWPGEGERTWTERENAKGGRRRKLGK